MFEFCFFFLDSFPIQVGHYRVLSRVPCAIQQVLISQLLVLIYFWLHWVFVAVRGRSLVVASRGYSLLWCAGFSLWWLLLWSTGSRRAGFSSCGSRALEHRLSSCGTRAQLLHGMWDLPGPGLEPVSPALARRFLTTVPPGKSQMDKFLFM